MASLMCFTCDSACAQEAAEAGGYGEGEWRYVRGVEDIVGLDPATLEVATCSHRWRPGTRTAWLHYECYIPTELPQ